MVLFGAKLKNHCNKIQYRSSNNSKEVQSTRMIPNFSIKSFVPGKTTIGTNQNSAIKADKNFSMATLRRPKVFVGGAADGVLYPGDKVASINHQDTSRMTHHDAQNLLRKAGTSAQLNIVRPGITDNQQGMKLNRSSSLGSSGSGSYYHPNDGTGQIEMLDRDIEYAKVHAQPYRTNSLALPSPKTLRNFTSQKATTVKSSGLKTFQKPAMTVRDIKSPPTSTNLQNNRPRPQSMYCTFDSSQSTNQNTSQSNAAKTVLDAISNKQGKQQPFRTTPLVSPTPRTIGEVHSNFAGGRNTPQFNRPSSRQSLPYSPVPQEGATPYRFSPNNPNAITRNVTIGGTPKKIVSTQFNNPIGMYSDETLAEVAETNQSLMQGMRDGCDTPSQLHPGYVQGTKPHLPTPKDASGIRAKPSETFKIILESEMDQATNAKGVHSTPYTKQHQEAHRSSSSMSNKSNFDPTMLDSNINQSASFKRLMYSVMSDEFENN